MELVTMSDYIYATPNKVLENVNNAKAITKPMVDLYLKKEYKQIIRGTLFFKYYWRWNNRSIIWSNNSYFIYE